MITNKVLDKAIIIGEVWIYARLVSRLKKSLQLKVVEYTLFSFHRRETSCTPCDSGFKFCSVLLKWLKVWKTQGGLQRHKWLLGCSKFLIFVPLSSLGGYILGNKASFCSTGLKVPQFAQVLCAFGGSLSSSQLQHLLAAPGSVLGLHCYLGLVYSPLKRKDEEREVGGKGGY